MIYVTINDLRYVKSTFKMIYRKILFQTNWKDDL